MIKGNFERVFWAVYGVMAAGLGLAILVISLSKTSLRIMATDARCEAYKNDPVMIERRDSEGNVIQDVYRLPTTGILPTNPLYGFKRLRDMLWLTLSFNKLEKGRMGLFVADKKMAEAVKLAGEQRVDLAIDISEEAVSNWQIAYDSVKQVGEDNPDRLQLMRQMRMATKVYKQIIDSFCGTFGMENNKYGHLLDEVKGINEEIEKNLEI